MDISVVLSDGRCIDPTRGMPVSAILPGEAKIPPGRNACVMIPGSDSPDLEGHDVIITGKEYIINNRHYDLAAGYGILAKLTGKFVLIPKLRCAVGKETSVIRRGSLDVNKYWPMVVRVWKDEVVEEKPVILAPIFDFVAEAIDAMSILGNLTDTFNFEDLEEEEDTE